ncbi:MAG: glycosyltransferase, partial [Pontixanthobacter sp.]
MMGEILFLAHRMPFPPDRGDRIRSHHLLKALNRLAPVHVGCFADSEGERRYSHRLSRWSHTLHVELRRKPVAIAGVDALLSGKPVSLAAFSSNTMRRWISDLCATRTIDTIVVFSGQMGQYIPDDFSGRIIVDLCDVDSAKFEAYALAGWMPRRWIDAREGRLLAREEGRLHERADATLFVSAAERQLFVSRQEGKASRSAHIVQNGVDTDYFDPSKLTLSEQVALEGQPSFVFTGQMDYPPNVAAAKRFIDRLLPRIRTTHPNALFHCVGRCPAASLTKRDGKAGIHIWGEVADMRPFLAAADMVVAP